MINLNKKPKINSKFLNLKLNNTSNQNSFQCKPFQFEKYVRENNNYKSKLPLPSYYIKKKENFQNQNSHIVH